jgi:hypothetical protein
LSKKEISICWKKKLQIENLFPFAWKELACFSAPLRHIPLRFKKANTFYLRSEEVLNLIESLYQLIVAYEDPFCKGAKMYNQSFWIGLLSSKAGPIDHSWPVRLQLSYIT